MIQFGEEGKQVEMGPFRTGMEFPSPLPPVGLGFLSSFQANLQRRGTFGKWSAESVDDKVYIKG